MDIDQIHPSGGYYTPTPPDAQVKLRNKKLEETAKSLPVIQDLLDDLDVLIASANSLDGLVVGGKVPIEVQIMAKKELIKFARKERSTIEAKYKNFIKAEAKNA